MKNPFRIKHLVLLFVITITINSCKKDDDETEVLVSDVTIPAAYSEFDENLCEWQ